MEPSHATDALCDVEYDENDWGVGEDNNELVAGLRVGDNFAIVTAPNNYGVDFFILQCVKKLHIIDEDSRPDDFGNSVEKGDEIVIGQYYKQSGRRKSSYVLIRDKGLAFIYSYLVCASSFSMIQAIHKQKGGVTVYILPDNALEHITFVIGNI